MAVEPLAPETRHAIVHRPVVGAVRARSTPLVAAPALLIRGAVRGLALGALAVALVCAAFAAQSLHSGNRIVDWLIGFGLTLVLIGVLFVVLRLSSAVLVRLLRWLARRLPDRGGSLVTTSVPILRFIGHPLVASTVGIAAMTWASTADGPLSSYHYLFYFEIPIVTGAVVGLLVGVAVAARRQPASPGRRRAVMAATLVPALALGGSVGAWVVLPGTGGPVVREDPAAVAVVEPLALPDPSLPGPYAVVAASYGSGSDQRRAEFGAGASWRTPTIDASAALPARTGIADQYARWLFGFDATALPLNALVWYPADAPGRLPIALIAHGNHEAGEPSDPGYAYLGKHLASRGIVVVSVDQNFLNGDVFYDHGGAEMSVRAWLLLRHLELFRDWDTETGHPLAGRLDLQRVALMGHSRGGESAAVAAMFEADDELSVDGLPPVPRGFGIRAVVAIAPSDGMHAGPGGAPTLHDLDYLVIQGAHDGDLPGFSGLHVYHRVQVGGGGDHLKVAVLSARANHGRFNEVWDYGDAGSLQSWMLDRGSMLSSDEQEHLAKAVIGAFLARSLQGLTAYDAFFREPREGRAWLPDDVVETHWESSGRTVVDDFSSGSLDDDGRAANGFALATSADPPLRDGTFVRDRAARLRWTGPATIAIEVAAPTARALEPGGSLVFSLAPAGDATTVGDTLVELRSSDGRTASVRLGEVAPVRPLIATTVWKLGGLGDRYLPDERHASPAVTFAQTYEVGLAAFAEAAPGFDPTDIESIAFVFEGAGEVYLDDIGFEPPTASPG